MSHSASSALVTVTKSAVMKTDMTPSRPNKGAIRSSDPSAPVAVAVPPTGDPTLNFIARGFGVVSTMMPIEILSMSEAHANGDRS